MKKKKNTKKKKFINKTGLPPGTLIISDDKINSETNIKLIKYNSENCIFENNLDYNKIPDFSDNNSITWIIIENPNNVNILETFGNIFNLHPLLLEDILNSHQRPKFDNYDKNLFFVLKNISLDNETYSLNSQQISNVFAKNYVLTFCENSSDFLVPIIERIKNGKGKIRSKHSDYLSYAILDIIIDNYYVILENTGDRLQELDEKVLDNPEPELLHQIYNYKNMFNFLRKNVWPIRELINNFIKSESDFIDDSNSIFLRDVYDHTIQIIDNIESLRETSSGLTDLYMTSVSNKMNSVMQVLTIIATIFIPLTFFAGIYGMNFKYMPELEWKFSYPALLILMFITAGFMLYFFKKKKWF